MFSCTINTPLTWSGTPGCYVRFFHDQPYPCDAMPSAVCIGLVEPCLDVRVPVAHRCPHVGQRADMNIVDFDGRGVLHWAVSVESAAPSLIQAIATSNVDPMMKDRHGDTALHRVLDFLPLLITKTICNKTKTNHPAGHMLAYIRSHRTCTSGRRMGGRHAIFHDTSFKTDWRIA